MSPYVGDSVCPCASYGLLKAFDFAQKFSGLLVMLSAINYGSPYCSCLWFLFTLEILAIFDMLSRFRFIRLCTGNPSLFLQLYELYHVVIRSQEMGDVIHTLLMCCLLAVSDVRCTLGLKCIAHLQRYMCIIESDDLVHIDAMTTILHNILVESMPF